MLPKLTKKRSVTFQTVEVEPAFVTAKRNALQDLKSVERIRISYSGKGNKMRYAVEVFTNSSNCRMAANTTSTISSASSTEGLTSQYESHPTVRIEREQDEFVDLRDKVYNSMLLAHSMQYCKFCSEVLDEVMNGVDPGGVFFTLFGENRVVRKLTKFTEDLLARTAQSAHTDSQGCCSAQMLVPRAVHDFLSTTRTTTYMKMCQVTDYMYSPTSTCSK
ncbi:hypothetical protein PC116_g29319 [Phytophthora cactorum]|nr:hypothetical protein PC111_g24155 [Phytophthora cactorum]KAG2791320.1 hypothetical protein PC112_g24288 [Phytophthora cactorum]KAG2967768.1 hypothetical protein PC120_g26913 [Phytophthora cactorum]KAG4037172.1 hypothetical protein PC123_g27261 [Phytophthora cactorum]KAG4222206.1 hypothetical protein PC116_g29319 [Phytophthora cactorum]